MAGDGTGETLTVIDNRTGRSYELPISDGTVRAKDFRQLKAYEGDFGLMVYDPGFANTASCRSARAIRARRPTTASTSLSAVAPNT